ncbi:hypothetical protein HZA97_09575 [Candidatus Woesearchaeota archaeon]|nr:hypothetical protein [Candidatus Woesearchaeota archaeon]
MKEDVVVLGFVCIVVLLALAFVLDPYVNSFFSVTGGVIKSTVEDVKVFQNSLSSVKKDGVEVLSIKLGPQERIYPGQNFKVTAQFNFTGKPGLIKASIVDCPLDGNLNASVESESIVFDVFATKSGLYSCNLLLNYQTLDGEQTKKQQFSLPVYSEESKANLLWLFLGLVILLILLHLIGYDYKRKKSK